MDDLTEKELFREAIHRFSQPRYWPGLVYILAMALMIAIPLALYPTHPLAAILLAVPLFGLFQYYALIATHEAIHYGLCPNRTLNDALGPSSPMPSASTTPRSKGRIWHTTAVSAT